MYEVGDTVWVCFNMMYSSGNFQKGWNAAEVISLENSDGFYQVDSFCIPNHNRETADGEEKYYWSTSAPFIRLRDPKFGGADKPNKDNPKYYSERVSFKQFVKDKNID